MLALAMRNVSTVRCASESTNSPRNLAELGHHRVRHRASAPEAGGRVSAIGAAAHEGRVRRLRAYQDTNMARPSHQAHGALEWPGAPTRQPALVSAGVLERGAGAV